MPVCLHLGAQLVRYLVVPLVCVVHSRGVVVVGRPVRPSLMLSLLVVLPARRLAASLDLEDRVRSVQRLLGVFRLVGVPLVLALLVLLVCHAICIRLV